MTVYVFGNPDLSGDALPIRILERLRKRFPDVHFEEKDPNEDWVVPEHLIVLDTVQGIEGVTVFQGLDAFIGGPRVSMHDFDALSQLRFMQKLGKLGEVTVIGVPPSMDESGALKEVAGRLKGMLEIKKD